MTICSNSFTDHYRSRSVFHLLLSLFITSALLTLTGCTGEQSPSEEFTVEGEGITIESPWVRPAGEGRMSAGYFLLTNFSETPDTLLYVSSDAAQLTEIHESYEIEEGMMGMREVTELPVPIGETLHFQPGSLHIMFIQLLQEIEEGDVVELTLHFSQSEDVTVSMPVEP